MKKTVIKTPEAKQDSDKAKRVYRAALDTVKKLDEFYKQKKAFRDVFLPESIGHRNRLKDYCERLMFYDPLQYGRRAEELLWRKVFYEIIQQMKHSKRQQRPSKTIETAFRTHLSAATGYYHHLLLRLQIEFNVPLEGVVDFHIVPEPKSHKKPQTQVVPKDPEKENKTQEWATKACHRCLVCLGDIARYQHEYDGFHSLVSSRRYYYQALSVLPDRGMPHNQLGTLAGSRYYNIEAAYHYLRCMMCVTSFEGAQGNLNRLFEKNRKRYAEVKQTSPRDLPPSIQRSKDVKRFSVRFMQLLDIFHKKSQSPDSRELQELCQNTLQDFDLCMLYSPSDQPNPLEERPRHLDNEIAFKITVMMMITIHKLQQTGSKEVTAAIAFHLAMFSHLLNHVTTRLQNKLYELENPRQQLHASSSASSDEEGRANMSPRLANQRDSLEAVGTNATKSEEEKPKKRSKKMKHRRRRRHDNIEIDSSGSDLSEGEEKANDLTSDSEEELEFLKNQSDSGSDSDDLMESQELRPGFFQNSTPDELESGLEKLQNLQLSYTSGSGDPNLLESSPNKSSSSLLNGFGFPSNQQPADFLTDTNMDAYLRDFSSQLFSSSSMPLIPSLGPLFGNSADTSEDVCTDVMQGKKDVSIPPGFAEDPETRHVAEITEKINTFNIDTDTDTSVIPDTDNSSVLTGSDREMDLDDDDDDSTVGSVVDVQELERQKLLRRLSVIADEGILCTVKILCDWMKCHPQIVSTCAQSSQSLWSRLSVLLNFLPNEMEIASEEICESPEVLQIVEKCESRTWVQNQPLREDINLRGFTPLKDAHNKIGFSFKKCLDLSDDQESLLRICCLRKFGYNLSKLKNIQITYKAEKHMFFGPLEIAAEDAKIAQEKLAHAEARRNQLMRDMAQLRLQAEVNKLEGTLKSSDQPNLPPYLVPDTSVLCDELTTLKQLVSTSRFIVIVPQAVIDHLDILKKSSANAREAIRWLEAEFQKGNMYIRSQKSNERLSHLPQKNLKKKDLEAWRFHQLIDCCNYLCQQNPDCASKGMVRILTKQTLASPDVSLRVRQAVASAFQEGIQTDHIEAFFNTWKDLLKSKG